MDTVASGHGSLFLDTYTDDSPDSDKFLRLHGRLSKCRTDLEEAFIGEKASLEIDEFYVEGGTLFVSGRLDNHPLFLGIELNDNVREALEDL